jgi:hypothetical protein
MALTYKSGSPTSGGLFVQPGIYAVRVIEATEDTSTSGNDMVKLKLRVIKPGGIEGPALFDYLVLNENAQWKIDQFLAACEKHPGEGEQVSLDVNKMIGWECEAELTIDEYKGKKNNKVAAYVVPEF